MATGSEDAATAAAVGNDNEKGNAHAVADAETSPPSSTSAGIEFDSCLVLYATQSGRAKACARRTVRILKEKVCNPRRSNGSTAASDDRNADGCSRSAVAFEVLGGGRHRPVNDKDYGMNDVVEFARRLRVRNYERKKKTLLLLFVSTTGDGEQVDSMTRIWEAQFLQKMALAPNAFEGVYVSVFCLGDRAYGELFCAAGRKLAVRLLQLGATLACPAGYGDDNTPNGGVFADFDQWFQTQLLPILPKPSHSSVQSEEVTPSFTPPIPCPFRVKFLPGAESTEQQQSSPLFTSSHEYRTFLNDSLKPLTAYRYRRTYGANGDGGNFATTFRVDINDAVGKDRDRSGFLLRGRVTANERMTAEDWEEQNTRQIALDVSLIHDEDEPTSTDGSIEDGHFETRRQLLPYRAGDVAVVVPVNFAKEVERFLRVLPQHIREAADSEFHIECASADDAPASWPRRCTLRNWLTYCADIHALPEREDLRALAAYIAVRANEEDDSGGGGDNDDDNNSAAFVAAQQQREKLIALSEPSKEGALYVDYILREKRSWADVIYDFDALRSPETSLLSIEALLQLLAPIRPREFSIASSPTEQHQQRKLSKNVGGFGLELCVAVVEGTTPLGRSFHGLCSTYLSRLVAGESEVCLWVRPGSFQKLPLKLTSSDGSNFNAPVLCIGAGTGIAPLRGLIREREAIRRLQQGSDSTSKSLESSCTSEFDRDNLLFFGCRKEKADFYYRSEWDELTASGRLCLRTAFSRDQWHKIYVQKVLELIDSGEGDDGDVGRRFIARHVLERNGAVYIAGGPKMARAVKDVIVASLAREMGGNEKAAKQALTKLRRLGLFSVEAWS